MKVRGQSPGGEGTTSLKTIGFFCAIDVPEPATLIIKMDIINTVTNTNIFFMIFSPFLRAPKNTIRSLDYIDYKNDYTDSTPPPL
jgi:hypothetical protein